jgi:hypothetical protein
MKAKQTWSRMKWLNLFLHFIIMTSEWYFNPSVAIESSSDTTAVPM